MLKGLTKILSLIVIFFGVCSFAYAGKLPCPPLNQINKANTTSMTVEKRGDDGYYIASTKTLVNEDGQWIIGCTGVMEKSEKKAIKMCQSFIKYAIGATGRENYGKMTVCLYDGYVIAASIPSFT